MLTETNTPAARPLRTIVIVWTSTENRWDGEVYASDIGARPTFVETKVAKAAVWLNEGAPADIRRAKAHAKLDGGKVFTFKPSHSDPLGAARAKALAA